MLGKALILLGLVVLGLGLAVTMGFRGLPGDLVYRGNQVTVYFPIVSSIVLSVLLTAIFWLVGSRGAGP